MKQNDANAPIIFFLTFTEQLPKTFYVFDKFLKECGFILIPIKVDQLQSIIASTEQNQIVVLSSVTSAMELKLFNDKVRGLLKFVLKTKRLTFMQLSSFSKINDSKQYFLYKNYYFLRYPLNAQTLSRNIARYYDLKLAQNTSWPGGKRAGTQTVTV